MQKNENSANKNAQTVAAEVPANKNEQPKTPEAAPASKK